MKKSSAAFSMLLIISVIVALLLPKNNVYIEEVASRILSTGEYETTDYYKLYSDIDIPAELPFLAKFGEEYDKRDFSADIVPSVYSGYYSRPQKLFLNSEYKICYTTDGTLPDENSLIYDNSKGIDIDDNTFLCVSAINDNGYSDILFLSYVILNDVTDYHYAYGFNSLSGDEKYIYDKIYNAAKNYETRITLPGGTTYTDFHKILLCVNYDNPLMFQLPLACFNWEGNSSDLMAVNIKYDFEKSAVDKYSKLTVREAEEIMAKADGSMSLIDYLCIIHDEIILNCSYSVTMEAEHDYEASGVLVMKSGVCESYSRAFQYICQRIGIKNLLVVGQCGDEGHMWNMINIDNQWYHMDLTWDDGETDDEIYYDYFNFNDEMIKLYGDRIISPLFTQNENINDANYYPIPFANGKKYTFENYYYNFTVNDEQ